MDKSIPYFIQVRGCKNCDNYTNHKDIINCYSRGCADYDVSLLESFIDIEVQLGLFKKIVKDYPEAKSHIKNCLEQ